MIFLLALVLSACSKNTLPEKPDYPEFSFTEAERSDAAEEFVRSGYEMLFLVMIDEDGKVVKAETLAKHVDIGEHAAEKFRRNMLRAEFPAAKQGEARYREFIFPLDIDSKESGVEFL